MGSPRLPHLLDWHHHLPSADEEKDLLKASEENPVLWTQAQSSPPLPQVRPRTPQFLNMPQGTTSLMMYDTPYLATPSGSPFLCLTSVSLAAE